MPHYYRFINIHFSINTEIEIYFRHFKFSILWKKSIQVFSCLMSAVRELFWYVYVLLKQNNDEIFSTTFKRVFSYKLPYAS